jgi:hypothetical protein
MKSEANPCRWYLQGPGTATGGTWPEVGPALR